MNKIVFAALIAVSAVAMAQNVPPAPEKSTTQPKRYRGNPEAGLVSRTLKEGKVFRFIDMRKDGADLKGIIAKMPQSFDFAVDTAKADKADGCPMEAAMKALKGGQVGAAVVIANEGADKPSIIVCPEDAVAVINVDKLAKDLPAEKADEVLTKRLTKEMWRAAAFIMGGYEVQYPCVMKGVTSMADLDANPLEMTCPPVSGHIAKTGEKLGLAKIQCVPYFIAVRQGWAPAPVNDAQKAEVEKWNKMKAEKAEAKKADKPAEAPATK